MIVLFWQNLWRLSEQIVLHSIQNEINKAQSCNDTYSFTILVG